ncbi:MAG: hypothetical protein PGN34_07740 [Methylobacterium frigidaeris]
MASRRGEAWTSEEDDRLRSAFHTGVPPKDLADRHERSVGAIHARLERLGLIEARATIGQTRQADPVQVEDGPPVAASARDDGRPQPTPLCAGIDRLIAALQELKERVRTGLPDRRTLGSVTRAYDQLDQLLLQTTVSPAVPVDDSDTVDDPLPDRLREALTGIVRACIPDPQDRHIAIRLLGLSGDGERVTLARLGRELGRSRERMRQRRNRAYRSIELTLPRRIASAVRLRRVLADLSKDADWSQPAEAARAVVTLVNDNVAAARQLTVMLLIGAGAAGGRPQLRRWAEDAVLTACRDPDLLGPWRLDRWADAADKTILHGAFARFDAPPEDMLEAKRSPLDGSGDHALDFRSEKLGRIVECESAMEFAVYTWLERSPEVRWYQEQPVAIPYRAGSQRRLYYPDAAVWDRDGRVTVIEVKPVFHMFRRRTLEKALAATAALRPRGIGYLLVDSRGRTLADLARHPYDAAIAEDLGHLMSRAALSFGAAKRLLVERSGRFDFGAFVSMVINRNWSATEAPVGLSRLPEELSFRPMLGAEGRHPPP